MAILLIRISSTQATPSVIPTASSSPIKAKESSAKNVKNTVETPSTAAQAGQTATAIVSKNSSQVEDVRRKSPHVDPTNSMEQQSCKNKNRKKKSVSKDELETTHTGNASSGTGVSIEIHEAISPTAIENTEFSTCQNTDTSFSNLSSRSLSVASSDSFTSTSEVDTPKVEKASKDAMSGNINTSQTPHDGKQLLKVDSALSLKSNVSHETTPKSRKVSSKSQNKKSELRHSKTGSSASTATIRSLRRADSKTVSVAAKERSADIINSTVDDVNVDIQKEDVQALAKINLDDPEQFPALGPAKSPPSNVSTLDSFITV